MDANGVLEKVWSNDEEQAIKDIKVRRADFEDLSKQCLQAQESIFSMLIEHCPDAEREDAAYTALNTLTSLLGVIGDYKLWLSDLLDQLEDRRKRLECAFDESDILWGKMDCKEVHDEDRDRSEGDCGTSCSDTAGVRQGDEGTSEEWKEVLDDLKAFRV